MPFLVRFSVLTKKNLVGWSRFRIFPGVDIPLAPLHTPYSPVIMYDLNFFLFFSDLLRIAGSEVAPEQELVQTSGLGRCFENRQK